MRFAQPKSIAIGLLSIPLYYYIAIRILLYAFGVALPWILVFVGAVFILPAIALCALATYALCFRLLGTPTERANRYSESLKRTVLAFLVAPLWMPVIAAAILTTSPVAPAGQPGLLGFIFITAIWSYDGMVAFGLPAFLILRAAKLTAFWISILTGGAIGGLTVSGLVFCIQYPPYRSIAVLSVALAGGMLGSIIGATFWLIARPDRRQGGDWQIQPDAAPMRAGREE